MKDKSSLFGEKECGRVLFMGLTKKKSRRCLLIALIIMALFLTGCSENEGVSLPSIDGLLSKPKDDVNASIFSDDYYLGIDYGGSSWGDYYDCISLYVIVCTDKTVLVLAPPVEDSRSEDLVKISSIKMDDKNYENIVKAVDRERLYSLKIESEKDVCDGYSEYLSLYDKDNKLLKNCGAYMPTNEEFREMYKVVYENLPSEELSKIRNEYIEKVREYDGQK